MQVRAKTGFLEGSPFPYAPIVWREGQVRKVGPERAVILLKSGHVERVADAPEVAALPERGEQAVTRGGKYMGRGKKSHEERA